MDTLLTTLNEHHQFIVRKGKIPFDPAEMEAGNPHDPAMWMDAETAMATASLFGADYGIGFVLTAADPFWCIDIDHCLIDGTWSPLANEMMTLMAGCAIEVSMSGEGLHLFGKGTAPDHSMKNIPLGMEFYTELRYIALTGNPTTGDAGIDLTHILPHLVSKYFPAHAAVDAVEWTTGPCAEWSGPVNDDILIAKATGTTSAAAAFGVKTSLKQLWEGDAGGISISYPDRERDYDASSADAALAQHLAFWTGKDCARIERLMLKSGLVRDKWSRRENGPGYLKTTILRAVARQDKVFGAGRGQLPEIHVARGALYERVSNLALSLSNQSPPLVYVFGGELVEVYDAGGGQFRTKIINLAAGRVIFSKAAKWVKGKTGDEIETNPCDKVVDGLLRTPSEWQHLARLDSVVDVPVTNRAGEIIYGPRYSSEHSLYVASGINNLTVKAQPSIEDAQSAVEALLVPFREFPFRDTVVGHSVLLAYLFTLATRHMYPTTPMFCVSANAAGSGKTLLVDLCNQLVRNRKPDVLPPVSGRGAEEEIRKRISTVLSQSSSSVNLDNWTTAISGGSLSTLLTTGIWTDRRLSTNELIKVPAKTTWAATGNNLAVEADMCRRCLIMHLDAGLEAPESRSFQISNIVQHVKANRQSLLGYLFTALRAYDLAGSPPPTAKPLGSFEEWHRNIVGCLNWLGYPDPASSQLTLQATDTTRNQLSTFLRIIDQDYPSDHFSVSNLLDSALMTNLPLKDLLLEIAPGGKNEINRNRLGKWITQNVDKIMDNRTIRRVGKSSSSNASNVYKIEVLQG